jgi:hypothetical protein
VVYHRYTPGNSLDTGVLGDDFARIDVGQVGDPVPDREMITSIGGVWAVPDAHGDVSRSPVTYNLAWFTYGAVPTGFTRHVVDGELAEVHATYRAQADRKRGTKVWIAQEPVAGVGGGFGFGFRLPLSRTEFHNVDGLRWSGELQQWSVVDKQVHTETVLTGGPVDHRPGATASEEWNTAVFGPAFPAGGDVATRSGDVIALTLPLYSDAGLDRAGVSEVDSGRTVLYREGLKVGETAQPGLGQFEVPAEQSAYRLEVESGRSGVSEFSTRISCVWTFTSARPATGPGPKPKGKDGTGLPLMAVRFAPPDLDRENATTAGTVRVPVTVQRPYNAPPADLTALTVAVSFDDGRTWQPVPVTADRPDGGTVTITHPRGARYVSLRAAATDSAGGTVTQTVLRAYRSR